MGSMHAILEPRLNWWPGSQADKERASSHSALYALKRSIGELCW